MLEVKRKHLDRREWYTDSDRSCVSLFYKDEFFEGLIVLITFTGITVPDMVETPEGPLCIADKGYQWLELVPKDKGYVITAMFHENHLFQQYIDITRQNVIANDYASFDDLFLDIVVLEDGIPVVIDSEELDEALLHGIISKEEYDHAKATVDELVDLYHTNNELICKILKRYRNIISCQFVEDDIC